MKNENDEKFENEYFEHIKNKMFRVKNENVSRETLIKNIYYNCLLSHNDINDLLNDLRYDGIIEKQFDFECLRDNLFDLFNDNIETIVNEILSLYDENNTP